MLGSNAILSAMHSLFGQDFDSIPQHRMTGSFPPDRGGNRSGAASNKRAAKRRSNIRARSKK